MDKIASRIAEELSVALNQVNAAVGLLDDGATVPFIARYRKEVTGGLDDTQLRNLEERLRYLRELEERRETILNSIREQEKLTPELEAQILAADTKTRLEDLYLPYKPKRRTKAQIAREAGIEPLAMDLWRNPDLTPETEAEKYLNPEMGFEDAKAVLEGARQILMETFAEDAELLGRIREYLWANGYIRTAVMEGKQEEGSKFSDYFEYSETLKTIPSHRALAVFRGSKEGILRLDLVPDSHELSEDDDRSRCVEMIAAHCNIRDKGRPADAWLQKVAQWAWKVKILLHMEVDLLGEVRGRAEEEAIKVFAENLKDLLMGAPAGPRTTMGLDPGLRTGVKVVVVDDTGKLLQHTTIFPHVPRNQWDASLDTLEQLCRAFKVNLVAIGNGTASRETDRLANELKQRCPDLGMETLIVSESGASVYSASELAAKEFPDLDVSFRGAVSIARRLQDPLAELVKIDPKSIGVGQYQHDVNQTQLAQMLDNVVEDCVNAVGVDVNTASMPLLSRVSGLNKTLAQNIVNYRDEHGRFINRDALMAVPRMGAKTYELSAGFMRIMDGENPLDASAVHPEAYPVVKRIVMKEDLDVSELIGNSTYLRKLNPADFTDERFGIPTITDILAELEKPGRDPRPEFKTAAFKEGVEAITDLEPGMVLEGVVTNVTNFGAFVDIGVHQDGLVHISQLADRFVKDPREVVKAGDIVKVKVMEVDLKRRRIGLSRRLQDVAAAPAKKDQAKGAPPKSANHRQQGGKSGGRQSRQEPNSGFGAALANALNRSN